MRSFLELVIAIAVLGVVLAAVSCGGPDLVVGGTVIPLLTLTPAGTTTPGTPTNCVLSGGACNANTDCCSGQCFSPDGVSLICA